jgi:hypothetical protein
MKKSAQWAPAPNLTIPTVERDETGWALLLRGGDHAICRFVRFDRVLGIAHIDERFAIFQRKARL